MNFVQMYTKEETKFLSEAYINTIDLIAQMDDLISAYVLRGYEVITEFKEKLRIKTLTEELISERLKELIEYESTIDKEIQKIVIDGAKIIVNRMNEFGSTMSKLTRDFHQSRIVVTRLRLLKKKTDDILIDALSYFSSTSILIMKDDMYQELLKAKDIVEERNAIEEDGPEELQKYYKIFSYKDMCILAEENNYKLERTSGDHRIYKHRETNKIVPIPAHELGYGLMLKIQKQIELNKQ